MIIQNLRLLAFGHFADAEIDFGATAALHLVYGPNEAGKSTALRAITGLLYGIPVRSVDAHRHGSDMRVGATFAQNGSTLSVVRRKGNTNTLLDGEGREPIPEATLLEVMGGVDEATFRAMFGLDHVALRHGAESLLSGGGSVGESLFDAGVSGRGIQSVLTELRAEADELYRPRGQRQAVNEALRRFKQAKERRAADTIRPDTWTALLEELEFAREKYDRVREKRSELAAEQNSLQRARRVLPLLTKRRGFLEDREALGAVVILDPQSISRRAEIQRRQEELLRDSDRITAEISEHESLLEGLDVSEDLVRIDRERIEGIHGRLGEYRKAVADLPKRAAELKVRESEVERTAATVELTADAADLEKARVGVRVHSAVRALATERDKIDARSEDLRARLTERENDLESLLARASELPLPPDITELASTIESARDVANAPTRIEQLALEIASLEQSLSDGVATLAPWGGTPTELGRLALPSPETVDRFARELDKLSTASDDLVRRGREIESKRMDNQRDLDAQQGVGSPPSEADLELIRERRDEVWQAIKESGKPVSKEGADALDVALRDADETADRLRREADRVAAAATLNANADRLEAERVAIQDETRALRDRERDFNPRWIHAWGGLGFEPGDPAMMADWLARAATAIGHFSRMRESAAERARLEAQIEERRAALAASMRQVGHEVSPALGLDELTQRARELRATWEEQRRDHDSTKQAIASVEAEIDRERQAIEREKAKLEVWTREWETTVSEFGLGAGVSSNEALAVLDRMAELRNKVEEMERMRERVKAIELDIASFQEDVTKLVKDFAPDLLDYEPADAADRLVRMHQVALRDLESRTRIEGEIDSRRDALRRLGAETKAAEGEMQELFAAAGVNDLPALVIAGGRSAEASKIDAAVAEVERELVDAGEGADIERLLRQTEGIDGDRAKARLDELKVEIAGLDDEIARLGPDIGSKDARLKALENEGGAAEAAAEEQESLAELDARVRRYVRVKLAATVLESEVERYREQNQGPILTKANQYFPRLTLGNYTELRIGFDAKDEEVLRCVRVDGSEVDIAALSDGTRDQLYLALRLATLEHFAEGHDPLPLVLDDVLIHFDDDRAKAALEVLGTFAETTQILFFTHHARLVELARQVVPDKRRIEHDLSKLLPADTVAEAAKSAR